MGIDVDKPLTDAEVDAWLEEHKDDPVDEAQVERVKARFQEKLAEEMYCVCNHKKREHGIYGVCHANVHVRSCLPRRTRSCLPPGIEKCRCKGFRVRGE
jgi:hypothetical protein